jgi:hypothetical protein
MQMPPFEPICHAGLEHAPPGVSAESWTPGDFILTHGDSFISKVIRFGEKLRIHRDDRKYTWFNHAALVTGYEGELVEALGRGVVLSTAADYLDKDYVVVHSGADTEEVKHILRFEEWVVAHRARYGWLTIASLAVTMLTGAKFTFFIDGEFICSGFVARAMERTGTIFNRDPVHITPADLAKYYDAKPPQPIASSRTQRAKVGMESH